MWVLRYVCLLHALWYCANVMWLTRSSSVGLWVIDNPRCCSCHDLLSFLGFGPLMYGSSVPQNPSEVRPLILMLQVDNPDYSSVWHDYSVYDGWYLAHSCFLYGTSSSTTHLLSYGIIGMTMMFGGARLCDLNKETTVFLSFWCLSLYFSRSGILASGKCCYRHRSCTQVPLIK
jgi:hypothetical protein